MEKKEEKLQKKKGMGNVRIAFSSMILFILFLTEIYLMIHSSEYFIGLVTVTVLLIAVLYILVISVIQMNYEKEKNILDEFDDLFKSEKAMYLLLRKNFQDISERLAYLEDNIKTPTEEIIAAQKAIAKVSIGRTKENTDALMNSNDKLLERFFSFEDLLASNNDKMLEQQKLIIDQSNKEILMKQQEAVSRLKEVELSIKNEILQSVNTITSSQPKVVMARQPEVSLEEPVITSTEDFSRMEPEVSSMDDILENESESGIMEEMPEKEPDTLSMDDLLQEESLSEETISEPVIEEPVVEEPIVEEKPPMPDLSDPNKVMSPEDIAALLANVEAEEPQPEPVIEEPIVEEKPPMPDLSDPNKIMSPEDIAALLANM